MLRKAIVLLIVVFLLNTVSVFCNTNKVSSKKAEKKVKVLFMVGGPYHDNPDCYEMFKKRMIESGLYDVTLSKDLTLYEPQNIKKYDVVMIYTTGTTLTPEMEKGLIDFVKNGKGLVAIHSATDSNKNSDEYWKMVGGRFIGHGGGYFKVNIINKKHPITKDMQDFMIQDETYKHEWHPEAKIEVLMQREEDKEIATWIQNYGKGRVFATGLGHDSNAWNNTAFQKMIDNALLWASYKTKK